jgi:lactate dehydrogenase-like 2-hydroxyacid dehydrogenase
MKPDILLLEPMMAEIEAKLDSLYQVHRLFNAADTASVVSRVGKQVRGIVTGGGTGASKALVDALPALEIIAINGIGTDAVDLHHARDHSIIVTTTPGVLTDDVADLAWALLLATARRVSFADRFVRAGRWPRGGPPLSTKVSGKRLGIFGLGKIGLAIAKRAEGFDMPVAYSGRSRNETVAYRYEPSLEGLAAASDFLIISVSASPATRGIVSRAVLDALGPAGILVNVARGSVVDEPALVAALAEGRIGGAGLDVFAHEPQVPEALWAMDNVVLQPHQASATVETRLAMANLVLANLEAHFAGRGPITPVV